MLYSSIQKKTSQILYMYTYICEYTHTRESKRSDDSCGSCGVHLRNVCYIIRLLHGGGIAKNTTDDKRDSNGI